MGIAIGKNKLIDRIARTGLISKGIVYCMMGILAFMAAFEIAGTSDKDADSSGVFNLIKDAPAGPWLLGLLALGLICYSAWRFVQTFSNNDGEEEKKWAKRLRYLFSGLSYLALAFTAIKMMLGNNSKGNKNQELSSEILDKPFGQWMLIIAAVAIAATGIYQGWYGMAGKFKKHVEGLDLRSKGSSILLRAGTIGYVARGIVWLIIAYLLMRAALHAKAEEAGDTAKAFEFVETSTFGSWLLGAIGLGLISYGVFNFIRAKFQKQ